MDTRIKKTIFIALYVAVIGVSSANSETKKFCELDVEGTEIGTEVISIGIDYLDQIFGKNNNCWIEKNDQRKTITNTVKDIAIKYIF